MGKREGKAYYKVFALADGTVILGMPTRKPHPKSLRGKDKIDDDGVWCWFTEGHDDIDGFKQEIKPLVYSTIANKINVKRALREQVETKLDDLSRQMALLPRAHGADRAQAGRTRSHRGFEVIRQHRTAPTSKHNETVRDE